MNASLATPGKPWSTVGRGVYPPGVHPLRAYRDGVGVVRFQTHVDESGVHHRLLSERSHDAQDPKVRPVFDQSTYLEVLVYDIPVPLPDPGGFLGQTRGATDHSEGATHGNVYMLTLLDIDPERVDYGDLLFFRSMDNGVNWSAPIKINDDPPSPTGWQWFNTLSVAPKRADRRGVERHPQLS